MNENQKLREALERIIACAWDCAAPGESCHDIARAALAAQEPPERIGNRTANEWLSDLSLRYPTHTFEELEALVAAAFRAAPPQDKK